MNIQEMIHQDYLVAVTVAENTARRFPPGSSQRVRWLMVAGVYRELTGASPAEAGAARWNRPAPAA